MITTEKIRRKVAKARIISVEQAESLPQHVFEEFGRTAPPAAPVPDIAEISPEIPTEQPDDSLSMEEIQADIQHAYDRGFSDGQAVTSALMEAEIGRMRESTKNLDTIIVELREQFVMEVDKLQAVAVQVALACAEHILDREVSVNTQVAVEQARKVLTNLHGLRDVVIRVNPESYEAMKEANNQLLNATSTLRKIDILPDVNVENGSCLLETSMGTVDTQLRTQLEHLRESMEETVSVKELAGEF